MSIGNPIGRTNSKLMTAVQLNLETYIDYFDRLKLMALSMFKWSGLPDSISARYMETLFFEKGKAIFFKAEKQGLGFLCLGGTTSGDLNVYGEPLKMQITGYGFEAMLGIDDCVLMRNNYLMKPTISTIQLYAQRLHEVERSIDTNIKGQKFPRLIKGTEKQQLTLKNIYNQYDGNQPVIFIDSSLSADSFSVLNTETPYVADKLIQYKHDLWNECMSFLGINNSNTDKKERLIVDEVQSNNQLIQLSADIMLMCRKEACELINKKYNLNISVDLRNTQVDEGIEYVDEEQAEQGQDDENGGTNE